MIEGTADAMVADGWRDAGYTYVNIDDCWMARERDADGNLAPDPMKFPDGIRAVADYVHARGLKLGIYADAGDITCQGFPGSLGHEVQDAAVFALWQVDYLKYDNCGDKNRPAAPARYAAMREALAASGRPIVFSICNWGQESVWNWGPSTGNLWRTTGDIVDSWASVLSIVKRNLTLAFAARPGAWNDPDMLEVGNGGLTDVEARSHFSLWAIMAAPLLAGNDLRSASAATRAVYLNRAVIAVDQDPLGEQGREINTDGVRHVIVKPLAGGDRAVALFNEGSTAATTSTSANSIGMPASATYTVTDLWSGAVSTTTGGLSATVPAHGTVMLRVHAAAGGPGGWTRALVNRSSGKCLDDPDASTAKGTRVVIWGGCHGRVNENWTYTAAKQLQVLGKCLDADDNQTAAGTRVLLWGCGSDGLRWPHPDGFRWPH